MIEEKIDSKAGSGVESRIRRAILEAEIFFEGMVMTSSNNFFAVAAARGDGLHPRLRELFERTAANSSTELITQHDGMLQAGPPPASETLGAGANVTPFPGEGRSAAAAVPPNATVRRRRLPRNASQ